MPCGLLLISYSHFQIMMGDRLSLAVKIIAAIVQALVCGSLFYDLPKTSESIFLRPGILFFPILYFLMESMSETTASFMGRPILVRHKRFGFYRPTAFCIANAITDIPIVTTQVTCFSLIIYFMCSLQADAGKFFTFWIVVIASTLCFVQMFRAVGAIFSHFGSASQLSGLLSTICFVYGGKCYGITYFRPPANSVRLLDSPAQDASMVPMDILPQSWSLCFRISYGERVPGT